ncbi:MAG: dipeptidyl aminopeptidase/acylaminoacyl peptidase [Planctomycetota bacterium]|jgi:dipeptidyl aminopeptidase/acylaminoacyl peptidase
MHGVRSLLASLALCLLGSPLHAAQEEQKDPSNESSISFDRQVMPILRAHCQACHQPALAEGNLQLMKHAHLMTPRGEAALVLPGQASESLLIDIISPHDGMAPDMPLDREPLSAVQIDLLRSWIEQGALDDTPAASRAEASAPTVYDRLPVITTLAFSPDGDWLAVNGHGEVLIHPLGPTGELLRLAGLAERIESVSFSPSGDRLAVAGGMPGLQGEIQIWSLAEQRLELSLAITADTLRGVSWSHDGTRVAFGGKDNSLRIIDAKTGEQVLFQGAHSDWVLDTSFTSDDSHIVSVGRDRSMKLTLVASQQFIDNITSITPGALKGGLMSVERHPLRDELLIGGASGLPMIYRTYREKKRVIGDDYNLIRQFDPLQGRVFRATWDSTGERVAVAGGLSTAGRVRVHDATDGKALWEREFPATIYTIDYDPRTGQMAAAGFDGLVWMLDPEDGSVLSSFVPVPVGKASNAHWVEAASRTSLTRRREPETAKGDTELEAESGDTEPATGGLR